MKIDNIAVFMKDGIEIASSSSSNTIAVFQRTDTNWVKKEEYYVNLAAEQSVALLRSEIRHIAQKLGECRIVTGTQISGVIFRELDRMSFSIFEITQCSPEIFDEILLDVEAESASKNALGDVATTPAETDTPGVYFFDLERLQSERPTISSKQALKDFLENVPFYELRLVCTHIPPWLENGPYEIKPEQKADGKTVAVIRKKQCGGGK